VIVVTLRREQTPAEELANAITHGLGLLISIAGLSTAVVFASIHRDAWIITSVSIYGATLCILYLASTLYHSARTARVRYIWNIVDHSAIYLLIAGTYTPYMLGPLRNEGAWGWSLFIIIWILALAGVFFQVMHIHRFRILSTLTYLLMGWLVLVAIRPLWQVMGDTGIRWLLAGGLCYSLGVVFYIRQAARFRHAIWHLFVLGGSICHFLGILLTVILP